MDPREDGPDEEPPPAPAAKSPPAAVAAGDGSSEMVFLRPRLVVPGTFGPVDDDVYLMISVSDGRRSDSNSRADGLQRKKEEG